jgi:hypothetical protein
MVRIEVESTTCREIAIMMIIIHYSFSHQKQQQLTRIKIQSVISDCSESSSQQNFNLCIVDHFREAAAGGLIHEYNTIFSFNRTCGSVLSRAVH